MPHIKKRNKIYYVYWYEQGKHHSKAISPSAKDAEKWAANLTLRLYRQKNGIPVRFYPFSEFVKEYIEEYTLYKKPRTQLRDKSVLKTFIKMFPDIEYVKDFDDLILKQYISRRLSLGKEKATINRELGILKNMQKVAYEKKYLEKNLSLKTKFLDIDNNIDKYIITNEETQYIFEHINEPLKTAFVLGLTCGMRVGEACHIELTDINFEMNVIFIRPKEKMGWEPKNQTSIRDVPIHPDYKDYLMKRYNLAKKVKSNLLCCYEDGHALNESTISSLIVKFKKAHPFINSNFHFHF